MPLYLCQPGTGHPEPWRHGIQVYASPFPIDAQHANNNNNISSTASADENAASASADAASSSGEQQQQQQRHYHSAAAGAGGNGRDYLVAGVGGSGGQTFTAVAITTAGHPIRRVRHAEIVLVDDVCIAFDRYWLRLRWPGRRGGFSGYIAMGLVSEYPNGEWIIVFHSICWNNNYI